jgi:hypothetical protein
VFEYRVLRKKFEPKGGDVTDEWRFQNEKLQGLYSNYYSGEQIRENEMGRICDLHGGEERCIQSFDGKTRRKEITWKY